VQPSSPEPAGLKGASLVRVRSSAALSPRDSGRSALVIAGLALASILFFVVAAVPATDIRPTIASRLVTYHKTGVLIAGVGMLLLTAAAFLITNA
jgi:hypothetical protein